MINLVKDFKVYDGFFGRYQSLVMDVMLPYQEKVLNDEIEGVEKSHAVENFKLAAKLIETGECQEEFYGMVFQDSDVAKWLEAAAYSLSIRPDSALEKRCDAMIDLIGRTQHSDGYLNTYFTVKEPDMRWTNLHEAHELYCAGHMMEAAVAYAESTGKTKLLKIMSRMADHIHKRFFEEGAEGYPGHPEVELALMRMYRYTRNKKYVALAEHFINARGVDPSYFINEKKRYPWSILGIDCNDIEYLQNHKPVREQTEAVGHAVRAVYLYTGMADVALETNDECLKNACKALWNNITQRRMYVTGGVGSAYEGERFTKDYHLPNDTAYSETCASIGLIFFARRMLDLEKNGEYADVMERALYNCVLAGMQLDGKRFFYVNPLEVIPGISGEAVTHRHALPQRPSWYACACCPPNVARFLTSIGKYAWSVEGTVVYSHLFIGGMLNLPDIFDGKIQVETDYPYGDKVQYRFIPNNGNMKATLAIRQPCWSTKTVITRNGERANCSINNGYAYIEGSFSREDEIVVTFDMQVKRIFASDCISSNNGRVAFSRGPLVYCVESIDNNDEILGLTVKKNAPSSVFYSDELNGIIKLHIDGARTNHKETLYSFDRPDTVNYTMTLIPYYTWGNRGLYQMRVWIPDME